MNCWKNRVSLAAGALGVAMMLAACESQPIAVPDWNAHTMELDPVRNVVPVSDGTVTLDESAVDRHDVARWEFLWKPPPNVEEDQGEMPADEGGADAGQGDAGGGE